MRKLRWKPAYQRLDGRTGGAIADLVERLNRFADEADRVSHCGDLPELYERIRSRVREDVERQQGTMLPVVIRQELADGLPLDARGGPACTECGMCDALDERLREWAAEAEERLDWRRSA